MEITLFDLESGKKATIKSLDGGVEFRKKLPVVIEIDNTEAAIGINMAKKIVVAPLETK
jgi:Fe2+ transport system protein FeoA